MRLQNAASAALLVFLAVVAGALAAEYAWVPCMHFAAAAASGPVLHDAFFRLRYVVPVPDLPSIGGTAFWIAITCALFLCVSSLLPAERTALQKLADANALVLGAWAMYLYIGGGLKGDAAPFMLLTARTSLVTMAIAPLLAAVLAAPRPVSIARRIAVVLSTGAIEVLLCAIRVAAFAYVLRYAGEIAEANLYLFGGPVLDAAYLYALSTTLGGVKRPLAA